MNVRPLPSSSNAQAATGPFAVRHAVNPPTSNLVGVLTRMLDEVDYGVLLVTAAGELRFANQLAHRALGGTGGLRLGQGKVSASCVGEQFLLRAALNDASRGLRRLVTLKADAGSTMFAVLPIAPDDDAAGPAATEPLVMLVLGKEPLSRTLTLDFFARSQRLTDAESNVLQGLCDGLLPKEIAVQAGVKISTIRTQIGSVRHKTQTASIRDLVNKVASLPPITPAMKTAVCH